MKKSRSFRRQLFSGFLLVSLIPLLICSAMLLQIFRLRMTGDAETQAAQALETSLLALDSLDEGVRGAAATLQQNFSVSRALFDDQADDTVVNNLLFHAAGDARSYARFDLYDISGRWRYSTQTAPDDRFLPTDWGILHEAAQAKNGRLVYIAGEESSSDQVLHGAVLLMLTQGKRKLSRRCIELIVQCIVQGVAIDGQQGAAHGNTQPFCGGIFIYCRHIQGHSSHSSSDGYSTKNGEGIALPTQETYASFLMTSWPL